MGTLLAIIVKKKTDEGVVWERGFGRCGGREKGMVHPRASY